jgi:hypothetical protein
METHRRPSEQFDESLREHVLSGVLLHMIGAPGRVDSAMHRSKFYVAGQDVQYGARRLIFDAVEQSDLVNRAQIIGLSTRGWVESRLIEHDGWTLSNDARFEDRCVKFQEVRIVVVKPFCFHG